MMNENLLKQYRILKKPNSAYYRIQIKILGLFWVTYNRCYVTYSEANNAILTEIKQRDTPTYFKPNPNYSEPDQTSTTQDAKKPEFPPPRKSYP